MSTGRLKGISLFICTYLLTTPVFTQSVQDSLFQLWQDQDQTDSVRAWAFYDFIYNDAFYNSPDSAIILEQELIEFCKQAQLEVLTVEAIKLLGYTYFRKGTYADALATYREGMNLAEQYHDSIGLADILLRTGFIYHDNEDLITALEYYERSLNIFELLKDTSGLSSVYNEFGSIYRSRGDYEKALEYYELASAFYRRLNDGNASSAMQQNIGHLYLDQGDLEQALQYTQQALAIDEAINNKLAIATGYATIGEILLEQNEDVKGLEYLEKSLEISREINDIQGASNTLIVLGDYYIDQGQYQLASRYARESLRLSASLGDLGGQEAANEQLYTINRSLGNAEIALNYHEAMWRFTDSMQSEATSEKLQQMSFARQVLADSMAQVERELETRLAFEAEMRIKDQNRNIAIGLGLFFLILSLGLYSRWRYVNRSKAIIEKEKERSDNLLLNILPSEIAEELKRDGQAAARDFDMVSILFTDFKSFTEKAAQLSASELLDELNHCFRTFDLICEEYQIEKIKTIGDAYMAAGGLPVPADDAAQRTVLAALKMQEFIRQRYSARNIAHEVGFEMRVGIHTGPVVAGIVGVKKFQYDLWGDTVNTAARMEAAGAVGKVNISHDTYLLLSGDPNFSFTPRGSIDVRGKGPLEMWFVERNVDIS